jgi:Predicted integral membrane protein
MIRKSLLSKSNSPEFRLRGKDPGRLENFSDAIFALAITLLLISTSPPQNFDQIKRFVFDLLPFVMCIALIIVIWYEHYTFFARYGLRNEKIVFLNAIFLIIVLFYVYPLKFLTKLSLYMIAVPFNIEWLLKDLRAMISGNDMADLMVIYGMGAASVFLILALMYRLAYQRSDELELNDIEKFDTKVKVRTNVLMASVPLISVLMAILLKPHWSAGMISGFTYFLYTPIMLIHGRSVEIKRKKLMEGLGSEIGTNEMIRED